MVKSALKMITQYGMLAQALFPLKGSPVEEFIQQQLQKIHFLALLVLPDQRIKFNQIQVLQIPKEMFMESIQKEVFVFLVGVVLN